MEGIYCGKENCYDVLGVTRDSTRNEIAKKYRSLAKKYHPDLHREPEAKEAAEEQFKLIATAYETLKDEGSRQDYDYMLDHPEEYYNIYYRYYRRRMAPQVDIRIVIFVTISIISVIQYYSRWQNYEFAIKSFMAVPKYKNQALNIAKEEGLLPNERKVRGEKAISEQEKEKIIKKIIEEKMDIKGAYAKPTWTDILWVQIIIFPYTLLKYIHFYLSWFVRHTIMQQPYDEEEKLYIIRRYLKMGEQRFNSECGDMKEEFLRREMWIRENFDEWFKEEQEKIKREFADNSRYKRQRRYLKNHGVPRDRKSVV